MKRKKILHITTVSSIGGAERLIIELVGEHKRLLPEADFFVLVIGERGVLNDELNKICIKNLNLNVTLIIGLPFALWKLFRFVRLERINLIHSHLFLGGVFASFVKLLHPSIKIVHTRHYADVYQVYRKNLLRFIIEKYFVNKLVDRLVAISDNVWKTLLSEKACQKKIDLIYNGVQRDFKKAFTNEERKQKEKIMHQVTLFKKKYKNGIVAYNIGAFRREKGQLKILRLINYMKSTGSPIYVLFIGEGPEENKLRAFCHENQLNDFVDFLGFQQNPYYLIEEVDIFLHIPDLEGFGLVVCEAMREKKLILTSKTGGIKELIENGKNGYFLKSNSLEDQAELIKNVNKISGEEKNRITEFALKKVIENFTIEICSKKYMSLYRALLDGMENF